MKAFLLAATAVFLMIPPAYAQISESLLEAEPPAAATLTVEEPAPPVAEQAPAVEEKAPMAAAPKAVQKKAKTAVKKVAKKKIAKKKVAKKAAKAKTAKSKAAPNRDYVYSPKAAKKSGKKKSPQRDQFLEPEQEESAAPTPDVTSVLTSVGSSPIYSRSGAPIKSGQ